MTAATRISMARVDRLWRGRTVVTAVGPLAVPPRSAVVGALARLAAAGPATRVGLRFDPGSDDHWLYRRDGLDRWADSCVVALEPGADEGEPLTEVMDALTTRVAAARPPDCPLRVFLADRHVVVAADHALGDSRLVAGLPGRLVGLAGGAGLPAGAAAPVDPNPLRSALRQTFASVPNVRPVIAEWSAGRSARSAHRVGPPGAAPRTVLFSPEPVAVTEAGPVGGARTLQAWSRTNARGAAAFAVLLAAVRQSLVEHGVACAPGVHMVFDLRRYLPRERRTTGNFVSGVDLSGPISDPAAFTASVTRTARSGRPLAALTASLVRAEARRPGPARPTHRPAHPPAELALSYVGLLDYDDTLPWTAPPAGRGYWSHTEPAGPAAITLLVALAARRFVVSSSFHASVFDPATIRAAIRAALVDPVPLLDRTRGAGAARPDPVSG